MKVTMRDYWRRRVQRGAMWLDMTLPGWYRRIDLVRLDLNRDCDCIVGQLTGSFVQYAAGFMPTDVDFGVSLVPVVDRLSVITCCEGCISFDSDILERLLDSVSHQWPLLTELWTIEINERLRNDEHGEPKPEPTRRQVQQAKQRPELMYA